MQNDHENNPINNEHEENGMKDELQENQAENERETNDADDLLEADLSPSGYLRRVIRLETLRELRRQGAGVFVEDELAQLWMYIEDALETGDLAGLRRLKVAFDETPETPHASPQPWNKGPEPTREELLDECAHKGVYCFLQVEGGEYPRSVARQLFEPPYVYYGQIRHDFRDDMHHYPVQVNIHEQIDRDTTVDILRHMATWIEVNWKELVKGGSLGGLDGRWLVTEEDR